MSEPIRTPDENPSRVESILSDTIGLPGYEIEAPRSRIEKLLVNLDGTIHNLPDYAASISVEMDSNFVMSVSLLNKNGDVLGEAQVVDLPLEAVVVDGRYDSVNKQLVLELQNGNFINIPISDLISGLQEEITSNNKLSADLVDDSNTTNKFNVQADWNESSSSAQSYINNKPTLGTAAAAAATDFATSAQGSKADSAIQSVKVGDSALTPDANKAVTITKSDITGLGIPAQDTTYVFEGTYNATTNKAATMADIKDGKLTGYAQSSGNVAATDKVIEAIGKVEKKADDNKTNILTVEQMNGKKNYFNNSLSSGSSGNITYTVNPDKSITFTTSGAVTTETYIDLEASIGNKYVGKWLCGATPKVKLAISRPNYSVACICTGSPVQVPNDGTYKLFIVIPPQEAFSNESIYPMVIDDSAYKAGFTDYQPYAMSNVELTQRTVQYQDITIKLSNLNWTQSGSGEWYSTPVTVPNATTVVGIMWITDSYIRDTDRITPHVLSSDRSKIGLYANTGTFAHADSSVSFLITYL